MSELLKSPALIVSALQQRLTVADEWIDVLEGLLRGVRAKLSFDPEDVIAIDAALKKAEEARQYFYRVEPFGYWLSPKNLPEHGVFHRASEETNIVDGLTEVGGFEVISLYRHPPAQVANLPQGELVEYQRRIRPTWRSDDENAWFPWEPCSAASFADYNRTPIRFNWEYQTRALYAYQAEQPKVEPAAYRPGVYAVRHIDNCVGERDIVLSFARLDAAGKWTYEETGGDLLTYRGEKILKVWPLDCTEAPDTPIEGESNE